MADAYCYHYEGQAKHTTQPFHLDATGPRGDLAKQFPIDVYMFCLCLGSKI